MMSVEDQYPPNGRLPKGHLSKGHLPSVASHEAPMTHGSTTHLSMSRGTA